MWESQCLHHQSQLLVRIIISQNATFSQFVYTDTIDYLNDTINLTFMSGPPGQRQCIEISIIDDLILENEETFTVSLTADPGINISPAIATVTITDDDG